MLYQRLYHRTIQYLMCTILTLHADVSMFSAVTSEYNSVGIQVRGTL